MGRVKILLLFTVLSLILFWPIFTGKVNLNGNLLVSFYAPYGENLPYKNSGWDQLRIYFPFYKVTLEAIKNFEVPLWNPYAFSGHPHMADFQSAVFYPLNIFGLFLSQVEFWHLLRITPAIMAAFFTFLYLRSLKLANLACIFGSITFGFSPFILTWGEEVVMSPHSIVWLPLILWGIERFWTSQNDKRVERKRYLAIISLATAFSFFGGYMQTTIYMLIFIFAYLVFRLFHLEDVKAHLRGVLEIISAFFVGAGISAVQLLPSAELFFNAARAEITLREQLFNFLLPIESLFTYLAPDFFGHPATANFFRFGDAQYYEGILFIGIPTLIFAGFLIIREWQVWFVRFLTIWALVALLTVIDWFGAKLFLSLPIPFLSTSIPNRVLFIPAFCFAVLAAGGFDRWENELKTQNSKLKIFKSILVIVGCYAGILVTIGIVKIFGIEYFQHKHFITDVNILVSLRNLVIPIAIFTISSLLILVSNLNNKFKNFAAIAIVVISFLHILYFSQKYFSFSGRDRIFPENEILSFISQHQGFYRSWGVGDAFLENNFASQYGIYWPEGYDSLNNRSFGEFTYAMQGSDISGFVFRADAGLGRGDTFELLQSPDRRRLLDLVGVKYVIGKTLDQKILEKRGFRKVFDPPAGSVEYAVFENLTMLPRAFLASNYAGPPDIYGEEPKTVKEKNQREKLRRRLIPQKLLREDFDLRNVIILEKPSPISAQFGNGNAEIVSYRNKEVIVKTQSGQPKLLFLSDNWYPGWRATVDGDETEIWRANYTFRAVPLTPGEHEVRFYYDSDVFKIGAIITFVSLGLLFILTLAKNRLVSLP